MLQVTNLSKVYETEVAKTIALDNISFTVKKENLWP